MSIKQDKTLEILVFLWIVSSIFDCVIFLPVVHYKFQFFELLFCLCLLIGIKGHFQFLQQAFTLKWPLLAYVALVLLNIILHPQSNVLLENLGTTYTCLIPLVFCSSLLQLKTPVQTIEKAFLWLCVLLPLSCLIGFLFFYFGITSSMIKVYGDYPYLGTVTRLIGLSNSPNKVVAFAAVGIYFLLFVKPGIRKRISTGLIISLFLTAIFTFSKEIVIIPIVLLIIWVLREFRYKWMAWAILPASILTITFFTFFYISPDRTPPKRGDIILNQPIAKMFTADLYPTSYYYLFRSSILMIKEHPIRGVGFGNYAGTIETQIAQGRFPNELSAYEAHDNYWGPTAQYGLGFLVVLIWLMQSLSVLNSRMQNGEQLFVMAFLIFFLLFGFVYHSYHMRLMWMLFGLVQFYVFYEKTLPKYS